jgi:hypothetical protein
MMVAQDEVETIAYLSRIVDNNHNKAMLIDRQLLIVNKKLWELKDKLMKEFK